MIRQTSLSAFQSIITQLGAKQANALTAIGSAKRPVCNAEIAAHLRWPINTVTPRVKELRERGLVEEAGRGVYGPTNRTAIHWRLSEQA